MNIYTVYDRIAQEAAPPFCARNHGVAQRMYDHMLNNPEKRNIKPDEFRLYYVGKWDENTMQIQGLERPQEVFATPPREGFERYSDDIDLINAQNGLPDDYKRV